jgi:hypothetical protein
LWGYVKNVVCQVKINDLQHLKARMMNAVAAVTPKVLQATWNEFKYRLDICCATKKAHTETEKVLYSEKNSDSFTL